MMNLMISKKRVKKKMKKIKNLMISKKRVKKKQKKKMNLMILNMQMIKKVKKNLKKQKKKEIFQLIKKVKEMKITITIII